jgi:hypothetical protein
MPPGSPRETTEFADDDDSSRPGEDDDWLLVDDSDKPVADDMASGNKIIEHIGMLATVGCLTATSLGLFMR